LQKIGVRLALTDLKMTGMDGIELLPASARPGFVDHRDTADGARFDRIGGRKPCVVAP